MLIFSLAVCAAMRQWAKSVPFWVLFWEQQPERYWELNWQAGWENRLEVIFDAGQQIVEVFTDYT